MVEQFLVFGKRVCLLGFLENLVEPNKDNAQFSLAGASGGAQEARGPAFLHCPRLVPINCTEPRINRPFYPKHKIVPPFRSPSIVPLKVPLDFCNLPSISKSADVTAVNWFRYGSKLRTLRLWADCKNREGLLEGLLKVT